MSDTASTDVWTAANQAWLGTEFARLKDLLAGKSADRQVADSEQTVSIALYPPPALEQLAALFGLSPFERSLLLLCAGVEMDSGLAALAGEAQGHALRTYVTFGLAVAALPEPHWSALAPSRPLRRFRLVDVETGQGLTCAPLRIDERILHYLVGVNALDVRLHGYLDACPLPELVADAHRDLAGRAARLLAVASAAAPVLQLCGDDRHGQEDVAALIADAHGWPLFALRVDDLPQAGPELNQLALLWEREALLLPGALLLRYADEIPTPAVRHLAERLPAPLLLAGREPLSLNRASARFDIDRPPPAEQKRLWKQALGPAASKLDGMLDTLSEQFHLSSRSIYTTSSLLTAAVAPAVADDLWNACRSLARPRLEDLAQRIVPAADWNDLVLPEPQIRLLHQLADQVRDRLKVYETWGFAAQSARGLGINALFAGPSGTGKTLAAEVLAQQLKLDLYRIDLSAVVSKYIGETEKNLAKVFNAAEEGGVLLLFDEADALFGKRGDVKDSHDRYANIEVSYLLQRIEAYCGLSILTTNLKTSMDKAFQRRLRFVVDFPFPDMSQREAIWRRVFPHDTPTRSLLPERLSQLNVAGGNIRNIALNAAFLAAAANQPVGMEHLLEAARLEAQKLERPLADAEVRGWA
ncbi:ATP-binding protein [Paraburkholderia fungorum]|uniref:ATP-binding protein n=1 Tax=Paraburkholderia fungorum TaxID=134537 RepID=UPI0038B8B130